MYAPKLIVAALAGALTIAGVHAQNIPAHITTPDKVETSIGTLEYKDCAPKRGHRSEGAAYPSGHSRGHGSAYRAINCTTPAVRTRRAIVYWQTPLI